MLSIIICCTNTAPPEALLENIRNTIGVEYEIISIDNSNNRYSIFSAYNEGYKRSSYPYLCFLHEDVLFRSHDWGQKIISHLQSQSTGIVGLAGGDLATRIPASWSVYQSSINIIQSDKQGRKKQQERCYPPNYNKSKRSVIILDGVLLAARQDLFEKIKFDENLEGFHGYDFDISLQAAAAGCTNYVIYDIKLEHFSRGRKNYAYYYNLIAVFKKWEKHLPIAGRHTGQLSRNELENIEIQRLKKLIRRMAATGFTTKAIISNAGHFIRVLDSSEAAKQMKFIRFKIFIARLVNTPKYLFR